MKSPRRWMLEKVVARHPRRALNLGARALGVTAFRLQLPDSSPLFRADRAKSIELPVDDVISKEVIESACWQLDELRFFESRMPEGDCVLLDVGANVGLMTRQLLHRAPRIAAAVCFEPHPLNFDILARNVAHLPQCRPVNAALGPNEGTLTFYEELGNAGNYSLNPDAMRGKTFRTSRVECRRASSDVLLGAVPQSLAHAPVLWKSDTQGLDESIATSLDDAFWDRVHVAVMELWCIDKPALDRDRFAAIVERFDVRRFGHQPDVQLTIDEILAFAGQRDYRHADLYLAREP